MAGNADKTPTTKGTAPADERPKEILWWSTPKSADEGRITVLACIETVIAMSLIAYIAWRTGSLHYIAVSACVAPLLLLRTPESTEIGVALIYRYFRWMGKTRASNLAAIIMLLSLSLVALVCRIAAVGIAISRNPLATLRSIPRNWRRIAIATDLHHPPEFVPGIEHDAFGSVLRFTTLISTARRAGPAWAPLFGPVLVVWFFPTLVYRWSLKSISVVYFPFLWAAFNSRRGEDTAVQRLDTIAQDQIERIVRWYAGFVLIFLTILPFVLASPLQPIIVKVQGALGAEVIDFWLFTGKIKLWHLVRTFNAGITLALFLYADKALRQIKHGHAHSTGRAHTIIGVCLFVRAFLGIYLAAKLLHVVVTSVDWSAVEWRIIYW